jgi:hypothetical protein
MSAVKSQYDEDFYAWTQTQAARLRQEKASDLDYANLAEEIESLGKRDRRELRRHLERLMQHLLKWRYQSETRQHGHSWQRTIREQRRQLGLLLDDSPSLCREVPLFIDAGYPRAREQALSETGLPEAMMPHACPWTFTQILDETFWPEGDDAA